MMQQTDKDLNEKLICLAEERPSLYDNNDPLSPVVQLVCQCTSEPPFLAWCLVRCSMQRATRNTEPCLDQVGFMPYIVETVHQ